MRPFLLCLLIFLQTHLYAQTDYAHLTQKVSVTEQTITAATLFERLHRQTDHVFAYDEAAMRSVTLHDVDFPNITLGSALQILHDKFGFDFYIGEENIAVKRRPGFKEKIPRKRTVAGVVKDVRNGQALAGVTVLVEGKGGYSLTDEHGVFTIDVKDSTGVLDFTMVGYATKSVTLGEKDSITVTLTQDVRSLGGVVVEARRRMNTEAAVLNERKNAAVVSDAISAQNIEKTASITTVQALQRVTGVTISNDRNVAIRGLGDRNVVAQLNGARLSGANPDQNSPPLDLVPAALLESITVYKTLTPDKPADATAGIIELKTKSIPERFTLVATAQAGTNTTTGIGGSFYTFQGSEPGAFGGQTRDHDLPGTFYQLNQQFPLGFGQLTRYMIDSRNSPQASGQAFAIDKMEKAIPAVLMGSYRNASPNQIYTLGVGDSWLISKEHRLGLVAALNYYKRTTEKYNATLNQYSIYQGGPLTAVTIPPYTDPNNLYLGKFVGYKQNTGNEELNAGGLATLTYQFSKRHEVSLNYMMNRGAQDGATRLDGRYDNTGENYAITNTVHQLNQSYRTFNTIQLRGEHKLWGGLAPQVSWNASTSRASELDPDNRFFSLIADSNVFRGSPIDLPTEQEGYFQPLRATLFLPGLGEVNVDPNGRRYRHLSEKNQNYTLDLAWPFLAGGKKQTLKAGGYYLHKDRTFSEYILYLPDQLNTGAGWNDLYSFYGNLNAYVGPGQIGFVNGSQYEGQYRQVAFLYYPQKTFNNYYGYQQNTAAYVMADLNLTSKLRLAGGVRFESTEIHGTVDTVGASTDPTIYGYTRSIVPVSTYKTTLEPYYSGNLVYTLNGNMNLRAAFTTTLARPELRELMPTIEFDPFQYAVVEGNPALVNQKSYNTDLRWEWFPASGEVYSVSAFYKEIDHQLTKVFSQDSSSVKPTGSSYNIVSYQNDPEVGKVYGLEFEVRKHLGFIGKPFFVGTNVMLARSIIRKNPERLDASRMIDRYASAYSPVFEQPPYSVNAYLDYDNKATGTDITASFNVVGPRLVRVQLTGEPDVYDHPAPALDVVLSQKIAKGLVAKGFVKNLLDPAVSQYYATPGGSYTQFHGRTYLASSYRMGREIALGFTYTPF